MSAPRRVPRALWFVLAAGLAVAGAVVAGVALVRAAERGGDVIRSEAEDYADAQSLLVENERTARRMRSFLLLGDPRAVVAIEESRGAFLRLLSGLRGRERDPADREALDRVARAAEADRLAGASAIAQRAGSPYPDASARIFLETVLPVREALDNSVVDLVARYRSEFESARAAAQDELDAARRKTFAFAIGALVLAAAVGALAWWGARAARRSREFERHLVGIVCHDLRTPLAAILLSAESLRRHAGALPPGSLDRIVRSAERMRGLTETLLDFARSRLAGGLRVETLPCDVHALCREVIDEARAGAPGREVVLETAGGGAGDVDPDRVRQAVANLLQNALVHGAPDAPVRVTSRVEDRTVSVAVENRGAVPPADLARFFEPPRPPERDGCPPERVGLGLFIVAEIARAHGGRVDVSSDESRGTRVELRLPRRGHSPAAPAPSRVG